MYEIYDCSTAKVVELLLSDSHKRTYRCCYKRLRQYLLTNEVEYSHALALDWLETQKEEWPDYCYSTYRTAIYRLNEMANTGSLSLSKRMYPHKDAPKYARLSDWSHNLLDDSLKTTNYFGNGKNYYRIAVAEFLFFLEENGVSKAEEITMSVFRRYLVFLKTIWTKHSVYRDRMNYVFSFMAYVSNDCVSEIINNYMANSKLPIIEEMQMQQIEALRQAVEIDKTSIQSRKNNIIHIRQSKTGKPLTLPMPIEVGNCIYKYIRDGRPEYDSELIFISHRPPYSSLSSISCADGLNRMLRTIKNGRKKYGFHITRKTFASRILQSGNEAEKISNLLGHDGNHTVMKYLAMDSSKMRMCSLSASKVVTGNE